MAKGSIPEEKRAEIELKTRKGMEASRKPMRRVLNTLFLFIPILLVPAIYHGLAAAFNAKTTYLKVLSGLRVHLVDLPRSHRCCPRSWRCRVTGSTRATSSSSAFSSRTWPRSSISTPRARSCSPSCRASTSSTSGRSSSARSRCRRRRSSHRSSAKYVVGGVWLAYILLKVCLGGLYSAFMG